MCITKNRWWFRTRGTHDALLDLMSDPRWLVLVVLAPYDLRFRQSPRIAVQNYGHFMYSSIYFTVPSYRIVNLLQS